MRYTETFLATLPRRLRLALRNPQGCGRQPFWIGPSTGTTVATLTQRGIVVDAGGASPAPTITHPDPNPSGTGAERYLRTVLTSGTGESSPAGLFGLSSSMHFTTRVGFVIHGVVSGTLATGAKGTIGMLGEALGPEFRPSDLVGGLGWGADSSQASGLGWSRVEGNALTALGSAAPRDARRYGWCLVNVAGEPEVLGALLDLSDETALVLADTHTWTIDTDRRGLEINRNPGEAASGLTAVVLNHEFTEGSRGVLAL